MGPLPGQWRYMQLSSVYRHCPGRGSISSGFELGEGPEFTLGKFGAWLDFNQCKRVVGKGPDSDLLVPGADCG